MPVLLNYGGTSDQEALGNLFDRLQQYGLFVVRHGELETWLPNLQQPGNSLHGPNWLIHVFEKMGEDPDSRDYTRPANGDVWDFLGAVKEWLNTPTRRGIPS